ncbi:MAG: hypothetical protein JNL05_05830 [Flavobacteriales bacterium]|nr:hypothetical protein [Flavobacteriales bacterium]
MKHITRARGTSLTTGVKRALGSLACLFLVFMQVNAQSERSAADLKAKEESVAKPMTNDEVREALRLQESEQAKQVQQQLNAMGVPAGVELSPEKREYLESLARQQAGTPDAAPTAGEQGALQKATDAREQLPPMTDKLEADPQQ